MVVGGRDPHDGADTQGQDPPGPADDRLPESVDIFQRSFIATEKSPSLPHVSASTFPM